ncbi:hypothetical protein MMC34_000456 [Xylographa carneopallida]|nr:hypothetical protein [Xylographa carneopallida]
MAFFWVQQWWAVPVVLQEPQMGDAQRDGRRLPSGRMISNPGQPGPSDDTEHPSATERVSNINAPYDFHLQAPTPQQRLNQGQMFNIPGQPQGPPTYSQERVDESFDMRSMGGALPNYRSGVPSLESLHTQQRFHSNASSTPMHQHQQVSQLTGQPMGNSPGYSSGFAPQYMSSYHQGQQGTSGSQQYGQPQSGHQSRTIIPSPIQPPFPSGSFFPGQQSTQPYTYYSTSFGQTSPSQQGFQASNRQQESPINLLSGGFPSQANFSPGGVAYGYSTSGPFLRPDGAPVPNREGSGSSAGSATVPSAHRGPPRKPKQSGHALWVGNLPPGTQVTDLKDHFSRDAMRDIESVFLISKSNCAFVNYRTEDACASAMTRFHDSRFQGVRLVCRLRRTATAPAPGVPTGPAALAPPVAQVQTATEAILQNREVSSKAEESARQAGGAGKVNDKYFIVKSLTVEDLELSARTGVWATQAHNEEALNKAFESVENVYLICSANKSGEYFGYARMASPISEDAAATLDWAPRAEAIPDDPDLPRSIPTPATEFAPKGRIIDDSARGTIFWEAEPMDQESLPGADTGDTKGEVSPDEGEDVPAETPSGAQAFGKPFKIEWLSTNRLPFYRTRGLKNPWNANREVKIARDGTELETSVGRRLVQMFHRPMGSPGVPQPLPGMGMQMGYAPMRPY